MKKIGLLALGILLISYIFSLTLLHNPARVHNSPDEHAAYAFSKSVSEFGLPRIENNVPESVRQIVHPRSTTVVGDYIVPGSFLGFPVLAGIFGMIFGDIGIYYFPVALFLLSAYAWFRLMKNIDQPYFAEIATVLYMAHPAIWYYLARTTMHNVSFYALLVIGYWLLVNRPLKKEMFNIAAAGIIFALSFQFRLFEAVPIILLSLIAIPWLFPGEKRWQEIAVFVLVGFITSLPFLVLNNELFGSFLGSGYDMESAPVVEKVPDLEMSGTESADGSLLLPFGFHERVILKNVWHYALRLFPWMTILSALGAFALFKTKDKQALQKSVPLLLFIAWLFIIYGSWKISDNPDPSAITIGNSYIRYWIPWSLLTVILSAFGISYFSERQKKLQLPFIVMILSICTLLSANIVLTGNDGLIKTRERLAIYSEDRQIIFANTEENAIIITDSSDKYIFPERSVVAKLRDGRTLASLDELAGVAPLYYFGINLPEEDLNFFRETQLNNRDLEMNEVLRIREQTLYRIEQNED